MRTLPIEIAPRLATLSALINRIAIGADGTCMECGKGYPHTPACPAAALESAILAWGDSVREGALREPSCKCGRVHVSTLREFPLTTGDGAAHNFGACSRPAPAPEPAGTPGPIRWLGDCTDSGDLWELTRRRDRFPILGSPTTLYFKMDDGTHIVVPSGWWIYDWHTDHPRVSSAPPAPEPAPESEGRCDWYDAVQGEIYRCGRRRPCPFHDPAPRSEEDR